MTIRVAINGYGRIGRNILRAHYESGKRHDLQFVAINDLVDTATNAHLLKYDSNYGRFPGEVAAAVGASDLVFLTDVASVRDAAGAPISEMTAEAVDGLIESGVASGGMIPKLRACARAAAAGVRCSVVDGREPHILRTVLEGKSTGTLVTA